MNSRFTKEQIDFIRDRVEDLRALTGCGSAVLILMHNGLAETFPASEPGHEHVTNDLQERIAKGMAVPTELVY